MVAVLAFDGVVLGDLATPCEIFGRTRDAAGRPFYDVRVCSKTPQVESEHTRLTPQWRLSTVRRADTIIIPGIDRADRPLPASLLTEVRRAALRGARVASICSGAFVLAATGLLDGKRATTHWLATSELKRRHPAVSVDPDVLYVDNGNLLTSAGAAAGLDLCLHIVRCDLGAKISAAVARMAVMPPERAGGQAQFIVYDPPINDGSAIGHLLDWLQQNLHRELALPIIARRAAMSTRTLCRHFHAQTGTTPAQWISHARVRRAQQLLETTNRSIESVATAVGFGSATVLRDHFRRVVGTSPQAYRRAFHTA